MKRKNDYNGSKCVKKGKTCDIFSEYAFKSRNVTIKGEIFMLSIILGSTIAVIMTIINFWLY